MCVHYFTLRVHYFSCCFLHWAVIFLFFFVCSLFFCVCSLYLFGVGCLLWAVIELAVRATIFYMYFSKMIHVFPQDDTCISRGWYHNCVHYFCWELSALSRDWAGCPSHLLSESRRCRGYVAVLFTARMYLLFYATMQICTTLHNVLLHLSLYLHTLQQIANNTSRIVLSDLFSRNEDWKNQIGCNSLCTTCTTCTMHPAHGVLCCQCWVGS